jgi:hypothetical protein
MYYDHVVMLGPDGSKTPSKIRIVFPYIEGGTWVRLAIPFLSGSTFTIGAFYGSAMMTQVYSKDDLDALKYYYDGTPSCCGFISLLLITVILGTTVNFL